MGQFSTLRYATSLQSYTHLLVAGLLITIWPANVSAGLLAITPSNLDSQGTFVFSDQVFGTSLPYPEGYPLWQWPDHTEDIDFDPVTGELYRLRAAEGGSGIERYFDFDESMPSGPSNPNTDTIGVVGVPGGGPNAGGDIEVYNGVIAYSRSDGYGSGGIVDVIDTNNGNATTIWDVPGDKVKDVAFDQLTGDLYAFTDHGVFRMLPDGSSELVQSGLPSGVDNLGGDLAVFDGLLAVSLSDLDLAGTTGVLLFGTTPDEDGIFRGGFSEWDLLSEGVSRVSDVAFNANGELYALTDYGVHRQLDVGYDVFLMPGVHNGGELVRLDSAAYNQGGDLTLFAMQAVVEPEPVPEPSTFALLGMGSLGMFGCGWRRKRKTKLAA